MKPYMVINTLYYNLLKPDDIIVKWLILFTFYK